MASDDATGRSNKGPRPGQREPSPPAPSNEPGAVRLGSNRGGESPLRAQTVIGGVIALILIAVPLYLLRRPPTHVTPAPAPYAAPSARGFGGVVRDESAADAGERSGVTLGAVQRVRCGSSARTLTAEGSQCDALPPLERALARAIEQHVECAPRAASKGGTLNYVLEIDFDRRHVSMFAGQSGSWKGPRARTAARCVLRHLPPIDWAGMEHQYRYYAIAVLGTYPAPDPLEELPVFD